MIVVVFLVQGGGEGFCILFSFFPLCVCSVRLNSRLLFVCCAPCDIDQARRGLDRGFKPELTLEGTGGTYFLHDATRQKVAVFKPQDEEPFAPNNPR